jgi:hypothetical protein
MTQQHGFQNKPDLVKNKMNIHVQNHVRINILASIHFDYH